MRRTVTVGILLCAVSLSGCNKSDPQPAAAIPTPRAEGRPCRCHPDPCDSRSRADVDSRSRTRAITPTLAPIVPAPPTPRPTVDISSIPNFDRPMGAPADAESRSDQLAGCMTYSAEPDPVGQWVRVKGYGPEFVRPARDPDESWFEITAIDSSGTRVGREVGRFQNVIPVQGQAQTYIAVDCPRGACRYNAAAWWAAGGGRGPQ